MFRWYTQNCYYNKTQDTTVSNYYRAQGELLMPIMENEVRTETVINAAQMMMILLNFQNWKWAEFDQLKLETKLDIVKYWQDRVEEKAEMYAELYGGEVLPRKPVYAEDEKEKEDEADEVPTSSEKTEEAADDEAATEA